jgi:hypothetical protein
LGEKLPMRSLKISLHRPLVVRRPCGLGLKDLSIVFTDRLFLDRSVLRGFYFTISALAVKGISQLLFEEFFVLFPRSFGCE